MTRLTWLSAAAWPNLCQPRSRTVLRTPAVSGSQGVGCDRRAGKDTMVNVRHGGVTEMFTTNVLMLRDDLILLHS